MSDDVGFMLLAPAVPWLSLEAQGMARGSKLIMANCGHWCAVSPGGQRLLTAAYTICIACDAASVKPMATDPEQAGYVVPGTVDLVRETFGDQEAAKVQQEIKRMGLREL